MLDSCSIDTLSIEISKNQIFRSDFTPILVYMLGLSFLTTLNMYKDYFRVITTDASEYNLMKRFYTSIL